jgi:hypothetical protein
MQKSAFETKESTKELGNSGQTKRKWVNVWIITLVAFICVCFYNWTIYGIQINWMLGNPSIEQRTYKILRDNPLIGTIPR